MKPGFYRYKISDLTEGTYNFPWFIDGKEVGVSKVIIKPFCSDYKYLKYLDSHGFYRFFAFNDRWQQSDTVKQIGSVNNIITDTRTAETNQSNVGYDAERNITLVADNVSKEELEVLSDIYISPRVYLRGEDKEDWVQVTLTGNGVTRRRRDEFGKVSVTIKLPKLYAITSI